MKLTIDIPKGYERDFITDKFKDFFSRVIAEHGFDTRELMEKWKDYDITLKKDDLLFLDVITNK